MCIYNFLYECQRMHKMLYVVKVFIVQTRLPYTYIEFGDMILLVVST